MTSKPNYSGPTSSGRRLSRRHLLGAAGASVVAAAAAGASSRDPLADEKDNQQGGNKAVLGTADAVPFYGRHQAGIVTPAQDRLHFATFDVTATTRQELIGLLQAWTEAAAQMTAGRAAGVTGAIGGPLEAPPDDTGEALGLPASQLTLTVGFGPSLFANAAAQDRFGIAAHRPAALADLPRFPGDALDPERSGGDLAVQACAHDPQVAVHAIRNLARIAFGTAVVRYSQLGFGRTSSTSRDQVTPRNLFGFKDGTNNLKAEDDELLRQHLWAQSSDGPGWMTGGSYLVTRRIRMMIETWDRTSLGEQEELVGRTKGSGAPQGAAAEFDDIDFAATRADGQPAIGRDAHVRLAHPDNNNGARMLRRGYNFVDGSDGLGRLDAGLFFMSYQRDPRTQFVPVQRALARSDGLNEYLKHTGSAIFACPPGVQHGRYWGQALFA